MLRSLLSTKNSVCALRQTAWQSVAIHRTGTGTGTTSPRPVFHSGKCIGFDLVAVDCNHSSTCLPLFKLLGEGVDAVFVVDRVGQLLQVKTTTNVSTSRRSSIECSLPSVPGSLDHPSILSPRLRVGLNLPPKLIEARHIAVRGNRQTSRFRSRWKGAWPHVFLDRNRESNANSGFDFRRLHESDATSDRDSWPSSGS